MRLPGEGPSFVCAALAPVLGVIGGLVPWIPSLEPVVIGAAIVLWAVGLAAAIRCAVLAWRSKSPRWLPLLASFWVIGWALVIGDFGLVFAAGGPIPPTYVRSFESASGKHYYLYDISFIVDHSVRVTRRVGWLPVTR